MFEEKYFTLNTLNRQISGFEYGYSECRNVPRPLDNDHIRSSESKLSQSGMVGYTYLCTLSTVLFESASQMWLLGRLLPLMVGKYVPGDDAHWRCFLQLLRILCIATAVEVTVDTVSLLSVLIQDYLVTFNHLYPHSITPKLHYLLHLPRQMQL